MADVEHIIKQLNFLYGREADRIWEQIDTRLARFRSRNPDLGNKSFQLDEKDVILITYADQFQEAGQMNLHTLNTFLNDHLDGLINRVHLLPFYPYSSDDGFSVIDYRQVNPEFGSWDDISRISAEFQLMFDAVINHISRKSSWFRAFMRGESPYKDYFISLDPEIDLSSVFRPRALPLLTTVETNEGQMHVWTTFSGDQIDLDYSNPLVLIEVIDLLLFYIEQGARLIRLDAIGYAWKQVGTSSLNLPQSHSLVKIFRSVINLAAPEVGLITETNVPHQENIKYFGDPVIDDDPSLHAQVGDEAHMVYQFSLAPLILHTFYSEKVSVLTKWVQSVSTPFKNTGFFNFIASHDGIGVMPAKDLLTESEIDELVTRTKKHGGHASLKTNSDGSKSVYELNITLYDALNDPENPSPEIDIKRFLASQAIMLSLVGVPGIYIHSLFGSRNCNTCVEKTGRARSINREKFTLNNLLDNLADHASIHRLVFSGYKQLLSIRRAHPAFNPQGSQLAVNCNEHVFTLLRTDISEQEHILCLVNVSSQPQSIQIDLAGMGLVDTATFIDLLSHKSFSSFAGNLELVLDGYQIMWLLAEDPHPLNA